MHLQSSFISQSVKRFFALLFLLSALAPAQSSRIVTTFPSATETVFALGAGDRVVGVSTYCRYPSQVLTLPKVGTYMKPDLEKIALLRPDLVVIQKSAPNMAERLSVLGIRHVDVKFGSLTEIYSMISEIGRALDATDRASRLNMDIQSQLNAVRLEASDKPHPTVLIVIGRTPGLLSNLIGVGSSSYLGQLLQIAGGKNVLIGELIAYPQISLETVIRLNPDVILDLSMMGHAGSDTAAQENALARPWLTHQDLSAVRKHAVFGLISEILVTPGPRVVEAVQLLKSRIEMGKTQ